MNLVLWLGMGLLSGLIASRWRRAGMGLGGSVSAGIAGAVIGGRLVAPLVGWGVVHQDDFRLAPLLISLLSAVVVLVLVWVIQRAARKDSDQGPDRPAKH